MQAGVYCMLCNVACADEPWPIYQSGHRNSILYLSMDMRQNIPINVTEITMRSDKCYVQSQLGTT